MTCTAINDVPSVAEAILTEIRRDGFHVGTCEYLDLQFGETWHHADASHGRTGERWSVNARTSYEAAYQLATMIGWKFEE